MNWSALRAGGNVIVWVVLLITSGALGGVAPALGATAPHGGGVAAATQSASVLVVDADDDAAFESIGGAVAAASPGDTIRVRSGTYEESVTVNVSVTLRTAERATLDGDSVSGPAVRITAPDAVVSGFRIRGYGTGVRVRAANATIRNVRVRATGGDAIDVSGARTARVVDATIIDADGAGVRMTGGERLVLTGATIEETGDDGITTDGTTAVRIARTQVVAARDSDPDTGLNDEAPDAATLAGAKRVAIDGLRTRNTENVAIEVIGSSVFGRNVTLRNVTVRKLRTNSGPGIKIRETSGPDRLRLADVSVIDATGPGIDAVVDRTLMTDVHARDNDDTGVVVRNQDGVDVTLADVRVVDNRDADGDTGLNDEAPDGVSVVNGQAITLRNVTARGNENQGIELRGDAVLGRTVRAVNVSVRQPGADTGPGIVVRETTGTDRVALGDVSVTATSSGMRVDGENVTLEEVRVSGTENDAIKVGAEDAVDARVRDLRVTDVSDDDSDTGLNDEAPDGLELTGGDRIMAERVTTRRIEDAGVIVGGSNLTVRGLDAADSGVGIRFKPGVTSGRIVGSNFENNSGSAVVNRGSDRIDATGNWWGNASGPDATDCSGPLTCEPFLAAPADAGARFDGSLGLVSRPSPGDVEIVLVPANASVVAGETAVYRVVATNATGGIGGTNLTVSIDDTGSARIVDAAVAAGNGVGRIERTGDGRSVSLDVVGLAPAGGDGRVLLATVTLRGERAGSGDLSVAAERVTSAGGSRYDVTGTRDARVTVVEPAGPPPVVGDRSPTDPDEDGLYEDVNGDGGVTPGDATVLFNAVFDGNAAVTTNVGAFDFNDDGSVTPGDATVLFTEAFRG